MVVQCTVLLYSTSGNQPKQLATSIAQKWLTKEFAAGTKTGGRPDAHTTNPRSWSLFGGEGRFVVRSRALQTVIGTEHRA